MVSISRSMLLAASLLAFPLAGALAQHDPSREGDGKSTASSSASGNNQTGSPQSTAQNTKDVNGKPSENAATAGQSGK
jgi:hypothetical protein